PEGQRPSAHQAAKPLLPAYCSLLTAHCSGLVRPCWLKPRLESIFTSTRRKARGLPHIRRRSRYSLLTAPCLLLTAPGWFVPAGSSHDWKASSLPRAGRPEAFRTSGGEAATPCLLLPAYCSLLRAGSSLLAQATIGKHLHFHAPEGQRPSAHQAAKPLLPAYCSLLTAHCSGLVRPCWLKPRLESIFTSTRR